KGDSIKKIREESGAKINISDSSCPERIVTVTGITEVILKAFTLVARKLEEDLHNIPNTNLPRPPVTLRLIVPASQCGSLIGKSGSKIKEIRESSLKGATVPYRPKSTIPSVIFADGQAYTIQGQYAIPHPDLIKLHHLAAVQNAPMLSCHTFGPQSAH
ncbi:poly(rC)-binding protein 3-like, partial [Limulus polyphemus]|uniref:Poly(RC)-binding protein 3-like n=1 Tax=Limulus polyphemus TaxID=6850 RepID=A0ABM1RXJ2_LIMPO